MNQRFLSLTTLAIALVALGFSLYGFLGDSKAEPASTVYLDNQRVFSQFAATKEAQKELNSLQLRQQYILDSLAVQIKAMQSSSEPNGRDLTFQQEYYQKVLMDFQTAYAEKDRESSAQIWGRLNEYIYQFGRDNGYQYIFGANGSGTIMYADSLQNVTDQVIEFVNQRYEGYEE